ncbi:MAG: MFS transporter [Hyphomonas sp. 34-62-18]|nr:MFS transporter [Hyphomonas sp. 34-62-18]OZB15809.1 MAG: MFS transporter [Hyphomonas sp. 34-62-18]
MSMRAYTPLFMLLTGEESDGPCRDIAETACKVEPGNFSRHVAALSASKVADGLIDPKLVLSWLLTVLGAPAAMIGLLVPVREAGALLPQLFTAGALRQMAKRKWAWAAAALGQGLAALSILISAITLEGAAAGAAILGALGVLALCRSVASVTHKDVLGKTVAKSRRGTATGAAGTVGAATVLSFGALLIAFPEQRMETVLCGLCVAGLAWIYAGFIFVRTKEDGGETEGGGNMVGLALSQLTLLKDPQLQRFLLTRGLLISTALAPPYLVSLAAKAGGADFEEAFGGLGLLVIASALAGLFSSYVWGRLADVSSRKVLALTALAASLTLGLALCLNAIGLIAAVWALPLTIFGLMIAYQGVRLGRSTHLVDMASEETRAAYTALSNTLIGFVLLAGGGFGFLAQAQGEVTVIAVFAVMSLLAVPVALSLEEVQQADGPETG